METTVEQRVSRCALWMDENYPGWVNKPGITFVSVGTTYNCPIAIATDQPVFFEGWKSSGTKLRVGKDTIVELPANYVEMGFIASDEDDIRQGRALDRAWRAEIKKRRKVTLDA